MLRLNEKYDNIKIDDYVIMPNHIHFILIIDNNLFFANVGADLCVCPNEGEHTGSPLPRIIQWFKTMTTNEYIRNVKNGIAIPFDEKLWQRNYYEHIIRNDKKLYEIRTYIQNNPLKWNLDEYYK